MDDINDERRIVFTTSTVRTRRFRLMNTAVPIITLRRQVYCIRPHRITTLLYVVMRAFFIPRDYEKNDLNRQRRTSGLLFLLLLSLSSVSVSVVLLIYFSVVRWIKNLKNRQNRDTIMSKT